jgi:predicted nucleotidyltransferase
MATIHLPNDFKEFLQLLNSENVEYLLVGGYAVGHYGYSRATGDMDIWIAASPANAAAIVRTLRKFGFSAGSTSVEMFLAPNRVLRMGIAPLRIDLITSIEGVDFSPCFADRVVETLDGVEVNIIRLADLKTNKRAMGRPKDLDDLEHLP